MMGLFLERVTLLFSVLAKMYFNLSIFFPDIQTMSIFQQSFVICQRKQIFYFLRKLFYSIILEAYMLSKSKKQLIGLLIENKKWFKKMKRKKEKLFGFFFFLARLRRNQLRRETKRKRWKEFSSSKIKRKWKREKDCQMWLRLDTDVTRNKTEKASY